MHRIIIHRGGGGSGDVVGAMIAFALVGIFLLWLSTKRSKRVKDDRSESEADSSKGYR